MTRKLFSLACLIPVLGLTLFVTEAQARHCCRVRQSSCCSQNYQQASCCQPRATCCGGQAACAIQTPMNGSAPAAPVDQAAPAPPQEAPAPAPGT